MVWTCPSIFRRHGETTLVVVKPTDGRERCRGPHPSFFSIFLCLFRSYIYNVLFRVKCSRYPLALNLPTPRWNDARRRRTDWRSREVLWSSSAIVLCFAFRFLYYFLFRVFNFGSRIHGSCSPSILRRHGETTPRRRRTGQRMVQGAAVRAHRICHEI